MVACTLDYDWSRYVIAALICLFGGVVVLLPWRLAWYAFERWRRRRRSSAVTRLRSTLGRLRSGAEDILAGSSTVNKIIVSTRYLDPTRRPLPRKSTLLHYRPPELTICALSGHLSQNPRSAIYGHVYTFVFPPQHYA